ncbi:hypothetical protein [Brumimicrobium aurantiacum]|uniref:Outer membrane protein beta-barrel domain-containing protein n=1 Tax=Brumimicrobium aurantiacum TaxID=1737063 RepID=A0A3E1F1A5_9FLAO|nr:hypothetical protein [Brumimicrobium aurantiacum]RFC55585.1 hypothetical protein DXU93_01245 [Brumimicrobium aurantiacum]
MKNQFHIFTMILVFLCTSQFSKSQNTELEHTIQPFYTPFILKAGNLSRQYASLSNERVDVEYATPFIFESGINYVISSEKCAWSLGFSFMNQHHVMRSTYPNPYEEYESDYALENKFKLKKLTSNFVGFKGGVGFSPFERFRINFGVNAYFSVTRKSRIQYYGIHNQASYHKDNDSFQYTYELMTPEGLQTVTTKTKVMYEEQKSKPIFLPEISLDYELVPNLLLNLGFRCQFWETPENYRFKYTESGFIHSTTFEEEELHESRITAQGYYFWLGVKYDIPILFRKE